MYVVDTPTGKFHLRDFAESEKNIGPHWTVDIESGELFKKRREVKFIKE